MEKEHRFQLHRITFIHKFIQGYFNYRSKKFRILINKPQFRVVECKVVNEKGQNPVYLIHSMDKGAVCIDKSRFAATQTSWSPKFEFSYRSFRYQGDSDAKENDFEIKTFI